MIRRFARRRRLSPTLLLAVAALVAGGGCGEDSPTRSSGNASLNVRVVFPKTTVGRTVSPQAPAAAPTQVVDIDRILAVAEELLPDGTRVERDRDEAPVGPEDTRFRLELIVPPADLYRVRVEAISDELGIQFRGEDRIENVGPGSSPTVELLLTDARLPLAPDSLVATADSDSSITLTWMDRTDIETQYEVERKPSDLEVPFQLVVALPGPFEGKVSYTDSGLPDRRAFTYRVRARGANGASGYSNEAEARTLIPVPVDLVAVAPGPFRVDVSWGYPKADPDAFRLEKRTGEGSWSEIARPGGGERSFQDDDVAPATSYGYRLRATEGGDFSAFTDEVQVTTGNRPPVCELSTTALDFGRVELGTAARDSFQIANTGGGVLQGSVDLASVCQSQGFSFVSGEGAYALGEGKSQTVVIAYAPTGTGPASCSLNLDLPCGGVSLNGEGFDLPVCSVTTDTLNFGSLIVGDHAERSFTVTNTGSGTLLGEVVLATPCAGFNLVSGGGTFALGSSESRNVTVRFQPPDAGTFECRVDLGTLCASVVLTGTAEQKPLCRVSASELSFGSLAVNQSAVLSFAITNDGGGVLQGDVTTDCLNPPFVLISGGGRYSLAAGASRTVEVRFAPTSPGSFSCSVASGSDCPPVAVTGTATDLPRCSMEPSSLDFGSVPTGETVARSFDIVNRGGGLLQGTVSLGDCAPFDLLVGGGDYSLGAGDSHTVTVEFSPTVPGEFDCTVLTGNDGCSNLLATGIGTPVPLCSVSTGALDFGDVPVGQSADLEVVLHNIGTGTLSGVVSASCNDFSIVSGDGSYGIVAGDSLVVTVRFSPSQVGVSTCSLDTGTNCTAVALSGTGQGFTSCLVQPDTLDFGTLVVTQLGTDFRELSFRITNDGTETFSGSISKTCSDFDFGPGAGAYTLAPGEFKDMIVRYRPKSFGEHSCTIFTGGPCSDVIATGFADQPPKCNVSGQNLDFGDVGVGKTASKNITIKNTGGGLLEGTVALSGCPGTFNLATGAGPYALTAGQQVDVTVDYSPTGRSTDACSVLNGTDCVSTSLTANGLYCTMSTTLLDFGRVPIVFGAAPTSLSFTMTNISNVTVTGTIPPGCTSDFFVTGTGPFALAPGQQLTVDVSFSPSSAGVQECVLDLGSQCDNVTLRGEGFVPAPKCNLSKTLMDFGSNFCEATGVDSLVITNDGELTLFGNASLDPDCFSFWITSGGGSFRVPVGGSHTIVVETAYCYSGGTATCILSLGTTHCASVTVQGTEVSFAPKEQSTGKNR